MELNERSKMDKDWKSIMIYADIEEDGQSRGGWDIDCRSNIHVSVDCDQPTTVHMNYLPYNRK